MRTIDYSTVMKQRYKNSWHRKRLPELMVPAAAVLLHRWNLNCKYQTRGPVSVLYAIYVWIQRGLKYYSPSSVASCCAWRMTGVRFRNSSDWTRWARTWTYGMMSSTRTRSSGNWICKWVMQIYGQNFADRVWALEWPGRACLGSIASCHAPIPGQVLDDVLYLLPITQEEVFPFIHLMRLQLTRCIRTLNAKRANFDVNSGSYKTTLNSDWCEIRGRPWKTVSMFSKLFSFDNFHQDVSKCVFVIVDI